MCLTSATTQYWHRSVYFGLFSLPYQSKSSTKLFSTLFHRANKYIRQLLMSNHELVVKPFCLHMKSVFLLYWYQIHTYTHPYWQLHLKTWRPKRYFRAFFQNLMLICMPQEYALLEVSTILTIKSNTKFISLAQICPSPVQPYSTEWLSKTQFISL